MRFEIVDEGFVSIQPDSGATAVACGPRCALTKNSVVVCTYQSQTKLGQNDFKPTISRSIDDGKTWRSQDLLWPHLAVKYSIFGSVSRGANGELLFFGSRTPIAELGESFWSDATQGIKQNELIWAASRDDGRAWSEPTPFPMPIPGSAEVPGPICVTRDRAWVCCYAPYNTFDPDLVIDRNQIVLGFCKERKRWRSSQGSAVKDSGKAKVTLGSYLW